MRAITTFGPKGYEVYGRQFLNDWVKFGGIPMIAYVEEDNDYPAGIEIRSLWDVPYVRAYVQNTTPQENYRFDVHKFCRKSFVQIQALKEFEEPVFWFDADVTLRGHLPDLMTTIDGVFVAYLGRMNHYPCTSFIGFNVHKDRQKFVDFYENIYISGAIYDLPEWHDAFVFDHVRKKTVTSARDLGYPTGAAGSANVFDLVFPMGHHKKGPRKYGLKKG